MSIFISHSFENKPEFENVTEALTNRSVPFWEPTNVKAGRSLRTQLRDAVAECSVCVFVATRHSIDSSWCGAELGAFWGAGKPIITYVAEASLGEEDLPPIVQGDVWERTLKRVAERAKELFNEASAIPSGSQPPPSVSSLTVEELERLIVGAVSLAAASGKTNAVAPSVEAVAQAAGGAAGRVLAGVRATESVDRAREPWWNQILWVDDRPSNNEFERRALEAMGFEFTLAINTSDALKLLGARRFAAIISDMGREEGPKEGYVLLEALRAQDDSTPFFIYAGSRAPQHRREAATRGAQGTTNRPQELIDMVLQALPRDQAGSGGLGS